MTERYGPIRVFVIAGIQVWLRRKSGAVPGTRQGVWICPK